MTDLAKLQAPFPPERISWRVGSTTQDKKRGMALAYIDARDVMARLDEVCGIGGWQCRYPHANGKTVCEIGIRVRLDDGPDMPPKPFHFEWVWKADGAGDTDFEAEKGALSDAFKRAAVRWGIGRYLYDVAAPWVEIEPMGAKSYKIADKEMGKLRVLLMGEGQQAAPEPAPAPQAKPADPKTERAREVYKRVHAGLKGARTIKAVDTTMATNKADLDLLGEVHAKSLDDLIEYAEMRREDLKAGAPA